MHQNALFLDSLAKELEEVLNGRELLDCFSTSKEDIYLIFNGLCIHASFFNGTMFLQFPGPDHLPVKNRIPQFKEIHGSTLSSVDQHKFNRSFGLVFGDFTLVFKCYGRNSNLVLFKEGVALQCFRQNLQGDLAITPQDFELGVDRLDKEAETVEELAEKHRFISPEIRNFLEAQEGNMGVKLEALFSGMASSDLILYKKPNNKFSIQFDFLLDRSIEDIEIIEQYPRIIEALDKYSNWHLSSERFDYAQKKILSELKKKKTRQAKRLHKLENQLIKLKERTPYYQIADVIMANLHQIPEGSTSVELLNFYDNETITISLKKDLSAQKNAEKYYKKGKNSDKEIHQVESQINELHNELEDADESIHEVLNATRLKQLKKWEQTVKNETAQSNESFRVFDFKGYTIWVGKSSGNNDQLLKQAHKDDVWLHARNVPGSHVLIRNHKKEGLPNIVLEHAAALAAYYSKSRNETLAEVIYTQRKYVRKFKGAAAGQVKVDQEKVILIEPLRR